MAPPKKTSAQNPSVNAGRPEVIVEFLFDRGYLSIAVRNIGDKPALKIAVQFNKSIIGLGGTKDISTLALFKNIEFLGPAREIVAFVDASSSYFARKQPKKILIRITYSDAEKRSYETTITHDLEIYQDLTYLSSSAGETNVKYDEISEEY